MRAYLRLASLYFVLLAVCAAGRWLLGVAGTPYVRGHHIFSIVILTLMSCLFYGAFCRRFLGHRAAQAMLLGMILGLSSQIVIAALTLLSYGLGVDTYFNHSTALSVTKLGEAEGWTVPLGEALRRRAAGLVFNPVACGITATLGWALGALLPAVERRPD